MTHEVLQPAGWPRPKGYANGMAANGRTVFIAGQIGWDAQGRFVEKTLSGQVRQALENILCVLRCAGGGSEHIVRLTWFVVSREAYHQEIRTIGAEYRKVMGRNFPTMSVVQVVGLMEAEALVEIEATAVISEPSTRPAGG